MLPNAKTIAKTLGIFAAAIAMFGATLAHADAHYGKKILADSKDAEESSDSFTPDTAKIYLQAELVDVPSGSKLGGVWIAEKTEVAPPNYKIDSVELTTGPIMNVATFSLSKPNAGWPVGSYRVDLSIDGKPAGNVHFKIEP